MFSQILKIGWVYSGKREFRNVCDALPVYNLDYSVRNITFNSQPLTALSALTYSCSNDFIFQK